MALVEIFYFDLEIFHRLQKACKPSSLSAEALAQTEKKFAKETSPAVIAHFPEEQFVLQGFLPIILALHYLPVYFLVNPLNLPLQHF